MKPQPQTVAWQIAQALARHGVEVVFGQSLPSAVILACEAIGIRQLAYRQENMGGAMADGYARATGKPGICMAQVIGALNLAAGLRDAWLAHSPVIAMTGGRDPSTKFRKVYQEVDDVPAFEPVTKFNATIDDVSRFPDMVRQAFRVAVSGTPGPVHLQFRGNEGQIDAEEAEMEPLVEPLLPRKRSPSDAFWLAPMPKPTKPTAKTSARKTNIHFACRRRRVKNIVSSSATRSLSRFVACERALRAPRRSAP